MSTYEKLRTLILLDCHLGVQDTNQIALLKNLTHLDLWGNRDLTKGKNRLINFEPISSENQYDQGTFQFHLTQLTYLDLSFTSWNSLDINASRLAPNFELFQQLTELIYDDVTLSDSDFFSFIDSLKTLTHLQKLSLQNTDIRETKAKYIADNLHNITSLDIRFNYTPSIGVIGILTSLEKLTEIKFHGGLIIEEIPQIVDALLTRDDFSRFVHHYYYNQLNKEDNKMLEEQKKRILNKFPNCHIVLDTNAFGSRSIGL